MFTLELEDSICGNVGSVAEISLNFKHKFIELIPLDRDNDLTSTLTKF